MAYLKTHFTSAHTALKRIRGPTLRNTAYHQANKMASEINTNYDSMKDGVLSGVQALVECQSEDPPV